MAIGIGFLARKFLQPCEFLRIDFGRGIQNARTRALLVQRAVSQFVQSQAPKAVAYHL
ncbi:hypothetical protein D3C72_2599680 [compost metagenome]